MQAHQLLVVQEQKVGGTQNRAQKVLQMVPGSNRAQRGKEVIRQHSHTRVFCGTLPNKGLYIRIDPSFDKNKSKLLFSVSH
jgi:hypothetical protein